MEQLRRRVTALRPDWDPAGLSGFLYLEGGYSNDNYRFTYAGERYVLRVPSGPRPFVDRDVEQHLYDRLGVPVGPEVVAFDRRSGDMISRWVAGRLLADGHADGPTLVDFLRRLHGQLPELERDYDPLAQALAHLQTARVPRWLERLASRLGWEPPERTVCHNDLNPWNVICRDSGAWVTLDWEWAGRNDPLFDLVTLHQGAELPEAELEVMARRYLGRPAPRARLRHCLVVFWLRETTWALAEIAAGNDRPEVVAQAELGQTRLRALAELPAAAP